MGRRGRKDCQGVAGEAGAQGLTGATGAAGIAGADGPDRGAGPVGMSFVGAYDSTMNYAVGNGVLWQGAGWVSLIANNHGNTPSLSPADWAMFSATGSNGGDWSSRCDGELAGPAGTNGLPGATGATGAIGRAGLTGVRLGRRDRRGLPGRLGCRGQRAHRD